ncbi:hypothetical protein AB1Y20_002788 [Prymnesium parvum]|uniref:Methyltransferase FkbM domain-containing protein n=1 Tax=Prymnesium parvum TaxID=97485 RepID=A0AB34JCM5_PRYPA
MALSLEGCGRIFFDGGANTGEAVDRFLAGGFYGCAMSAPYRVYPRAWPSMSARERRAAMAPLREPNSFCVRSFEPAAELMPPLLRKEGELRRRGYDVRFIHAALGNRTAESVPRTIVRYSDDPAAFSATTLRFADVHVGGKPRALSERSELGRSYSVVDLVRRAVEANSSATVAVKLDVEGAEWWAMEQLLAEPVVLCQVSYIFAEFHGSATAAQRAKLVSYGLSEDIFESLKRRVHAAMEQPGCKLRIYWRSFWASCGDEQRFMWRNSRQAMGSLAPATHKARRRLHKRWSRP